MINSNTIYIHYGSNNFDVNRFEKVINNEFVPKPVNGGLWASPKESKSNWNNTFKLSEIQKENSFCFRLKEKCKVLYLQFLNDLKGLPVVKRENKIVFLDFEKINELYDVIYFNPNNDENLNLALPYWDCECILILNYEIIEII